MDSQSTSTALRLAVILDSVSLCVTLYQYRELNLSILSGVGFVVPLVYKEKTGTKMNAETIAERDLDDVAHLAHVQLLTPKFQESLEFFTETLGMVLVHSEDDSAYLRGVWDYEQYCLQLTGAQHAGIGRIGLRARSAAALERRVAAIDRLDLGVGWNDDGFGRGASYRFRDPDGHPFEIYYDTVTYDAPAELRAPLKNQPQRHLGTGIGVRRLEHVNLMAADVGKSRVALESALGLHTNEIVMTNETEEDGAWMSATVQGHEVIYTRDALKAHGRLHHLAFWVDSRDEVLRAADIYQDQGTYIEAGPSRHTALQSFYLYCYEPGGNRIEITTGGYLAFNPDHETVVWSAEEWAHRPNWGAPLPQTFLTYGTPDVDGDDSVD